MRKNKGFMLVETLIASTIILGALIFLFVQFSSIKRAYENSFKYNTIPGLYSAKTMTSFLENYGYVEIDKALNNSTQGYILIIGNCSIYYNNTTAINLCNKIVSNMNAKQILYVGNNITNLQVDLKNNKYDISIFDEGFKKFILQLEPIESYQRRRLLIKFKNNTYAVISIGADIS